MTFESLENYIRLPRVDQVIASPDGSTAVLGVSTLSKDETSYERAWWAVPAAGGGTPRRLTRSAKGERGAAFLPSGDLLFVSARPGVEPANEDDPAQLWLLPADGGEPRPLTAFAGGVSSIVAVADAAPVVVFAASLLPGSTSVEDDAKRRAERSKKKVKAILHTGYPVRFWDHDLGPDEVRLFALNLADLAPEPADLHTRADASADAGDKKDAAPTYPAYLPKPVDLTPAPGRSLDHTSGSLSPDGATLVASVSIPERDDAHSAIVSIDVASGERTTLLEETGVDYGDPALSHDGAKLAYLRAVKATPSGPTDNELYVADASGADATLLGGGWDRWAETLQWAADDSALIVTANDHGDAPVFRMPLDGSAPERLTADGAFTSPSVDKATGAVLALKSSWTLTPHPVRIGRDGTATELATPAPSPEVPGTIERVSTTASDGAIVEGFLMLPEGASAAKPAPLLLWVHGGPLSSWNMWSWRWSPALALAKGYAVLLPDPALSTGYGLEYIARGWNAWGKAPYTDLMEITDAVEARADIDQTRTAAMGGSFGGYMANWIAGHTDRFKAVVTHASLWALDQFNGTTDHSPYWRSIFTPEGQAENSPHHSLANIVSPMLVIHGDRDYRVPIGESLRLWAELNATFADEDGTHPHRFLYFPDENHWILKPQHAVVWYQTVFGFLGEHVLGEEPTTPDVLR